MYSYASKNIEAHAGQVYQYVPRYRKRVARKKTVKNKIEVLFALAIWGLVAFFVLQFNFVNFIRPSYINRIKNRNLNFNAHSIISPTLNYLSNLNFEGENLLVPANTANDKMLKINSAGNLDSLQKELQSILASYTNLHTGIYVYDYISGKTVKINSDEVFPAASIIKIPVLLDLFYRSKKLEEEGFDSIDTSEKMTFSEIHRTEGSGNLQYKNAGVDYTLDYLAKIMIRQSDNSATNMLIEYNGGINETNSSLRHWGFSKTQISNFLPDLAGTNTTTPEEIAAMLYNIDNQQFLPLKSSAVVKEYMSKVENQTLIKSQIPSDAIIVHKTGDIGKMLGDAGIIYTPSGHKFILAVLVKRPHNDYSARELIQKVAKAVYNALGS